MVINRCYESNTWYTELIYWSSAMCLWISSECLCNVVAWDLKSELPYMVSKRMYLRKKEKNKNIIVRPLQYDDKYDYESTVIYS